MNPVWKIDTTKILTQKEITKVLNDLYKRIKHSVNTHQNLVVFRLATCCGLRVSEIGGLKIKDVKIGIEKPHLSLPKTITKGKKARKIPLWWDSGTLQDIINWFNFRVEKQNANPNDFFICSQSKSSFGKQISRINLRNRYITSCDSLGENRISSLTIHNGRHSYITHALNGGRTLAEVRDAAGHSNISTTSIYTHVAVNDDGKVGSLFSFESQNI